MLQEQLEEIFASVANLLNEIDTTVCVSAWPHVKLNREDSLPSLAEKMETQNVVLQFRIYPLAPTSLAFDYTI